MIRHSRIIAAFFLIAVGKMSAQIACPTAPFTDCNDPTPTTSVDGTWQQWDFSAGYLQILSTWYVTTANTTPGTPAIVSGTVDVPSPVFWCPDIIYQLQSDSNIVPAAQTDGVPGSTTVSWTAVNPSPAGDCGGYTPVASMNFSGSISSSKSGDGILGTWTSNEGGSGSLDLRKFYVEPTGETLSEEGWGTTLTTELRFVQTLVDWNYEDPPDLYSRLFQGRQVFETTGWGGGSDQCYDSSGGAYPGGPFTNVTGSVWNVGYDSTHSGDTYGYDTIGWPPAGVDWYQNAIAAALPCTAQIPQTMNIVVNRTTNGNVPFSSHSISATIDNTSITVTKDNVSASR
jgi:hypothetical protein